MGLGENGPGSGQAAAMEADHIFLKYMSGSKLIDGDRRHAISFAEIMVASRWFPLGENADLSQAIWRGGPENRSYCVAGTVKRRSASK
ncbi:hypothetical protein TDMWS_00050 [Thermodesulfomicrobium sp. WS]|nr:hypothetical protein TDMWS_00050 [Thermodesulfomicrobium sp. WS]